MTRTLLLVNAYPLLTTAQGDEGNARMLCHRAALRGIVAEVETVQHGPLPAGDVYLIGGLAHPDQPRLVRALASLPTAVAAGAVVLGVDAGFAVLGEEFVTAQGLTRPGLGLLPVHTTAAPRVEGPVVTLPNPALGLPAMSGYESHAGRTRLGTGAAPMATLALGVGNGGRPATDGAVSGHVVGTYLHGPVLARNPELADLLLGWALDATLDPVAPGHAGSVRAQRIVEDLADHTGWAGTRH